MHFRVEKSIPLCYALLDNIAMTYVYGLGRKAKMGKQFMSILLVLCIALTIIPTAALADEASIAEAPEAIGEFETFGQIELEAEGKAEEQEETLEEKEDTEASEDLETPEATGNPESPGEVELAAPKARSGTMAYAVEGGSIYFDPETGEITDCDEGVTRVDIPEFINGTQVTGIREYAFRDSGTLRCVTIPEGVTSIGEYAFWGCNGLTSAGPIGGGYNIEFGWTKSIPAHAFKHCGVLEGVTIPESVMRIEEWAFDGCDGLKRVTIPESVTSIGEGAFAGCDSLTSVTIPTSVTDIGYGAFQICHGLTNVTIPGSVTNIERYVFGNCKNLRSVVISVGVASIGGSVFEGCSGLTNVTIPDSVTSIGEEAFSYCSGLTSVTIPEGVTNLGKRAFYKCSGLTDVTIPSSVTSIGREAFEGCNGLTSAGPIGGGYNITLGWTGSIPVDAFYNCNNLTHVTIPEGVTSIGNGAFFGCKGLVSMTIPEGVTDIGVQAFRDCNSLTGVTFPESVTNIGHQAFFGCESLAGDVTIPQNVTSIGFEAFWGCASLANVAIPEGVTCIGYGTFYGCRGLKGVTIPKSVTSIGENAFCWCSSLTSVKFPGGVTCIEEGTFHGCSSLISVTIPEGVTSIGVSAFNGCNVLASVVIPGSVIRIEQWAFEGCTNLENVYYGGAEIQWNAVSIGLCNDPLTSAAIHYTGFSSQPPAEDEIVEINTDAYYTTPEKCLFRIRPIGTDFRKPAGFRVTVGQESFSSGNTTCTSTDDVTVTVPKNYTGDIEISLEGYHTNYLPASWSGGTNTVAMTPDTVTAPYLRTLLVRSGSSNYPVYKNLATDYRRCELSVYKPGLTGTPQPLEYYTSVDWNGHGEGIVWMEQDGKKIDLKDDGVTETAIESVFDSGKTIYVCARAADGTLLRNVLRVTVNEPQKDGFKFNFGESTTAKPDTQKAELSILDTDSLEIDFSFLSDNLIPIKFTVKPDGTVKGTIGVEMDSGSYSEAAYGKIKEAYTNLMDPRYGTQNADLAKELSELKNQNIMLKEYPHSSFGVKGNMQLLGYFTGSLADGEFRVTEMKGVFIVGGRLSYTHDTVVWGGPAHFKASLAAKIEAGINMKYNREINAYVPDGDHPMTASVTLSAQTGPGWEGYATLAGKGSAALKSYFSLPIRNSKTMWSISGDISFVGSVGGISGEWKLIKSPEMVFWNDGKAVWYEKGSETAYTMVFTPDFSRSVMTYASSAEDNAIVKGISGYTSPSMVALPDGRLLAVWTADVPDRSNVDKNGIYYSLRTEGEWSEPQLVWEDGTNDSMPKLWTIGNSVWLTWQNYTKTYDVDSVEGISYEEITGQIVIATAEFDSSSNSFTSNNIPCETYGYAPQMHSAGSQIELAWMDSNGSLWASVYTADGWGDAKQTDADWYESEVSLPSTYEGEVSGSKATIQSFSTANYQAILYTDVDENGISNVYGLFNDGYGWGEAIPLTDISVGGAGGFSAVITEDMKLQLLVNTIHYDDEGSYQSADLAFYEKTLLSDLTVKGADYVHETLVPGGTLTVTADVVNNSAQTISGLTASLDAGVSVPDDIDCAVTLLPGETKTVYINYMLPSDFGERICVSIYPQKGEDADMTDNNTICMLEMTDISLEEVLAESLDNEILLTAMVVNRGSMDISGYTVTYHSEAPDGVVISREQVNEILPVDEAVYLSTLVNMSLESGTIVYADVSIANGGTENLYGNNSDLATIVQVSESNGFISAEVISIEEGKTVVRLVDANGIIPDDAAIFAVNYANNGQMLAIDSNDLQQEDIVTFAGRIEPGWTLFLLDPVSLTPLCESVILQ